MSRILLLEKNTFFGELLRQILQSRFPRASVRWVDSREEYLHETRDFMPDIFVLGGNIYTGEELDLLDFVREKHPAATIILFTDYDIDEYRREAILRGASHVISKETWTGSEILALINTLLATRGKMAGEPPEDSFIEEQFLQRPLERRNKGPQGKAVEREYLGRHHDRREEKQI